MTTDPYLPPPASTSSTPAPTQPGRWTRTRKRIAIGVAIVAAFVIGVAVGGADNEPADVDAVSAADVTSNATATTDQEATTTEPAPTTTEKPTTTTERPTTTTEKPTTTTAPPTPLSPSDFVIEMFIIENECFNTAGALITAEPDLAYLGTADLDGREFTVVFEVTGGGMTQIGNVELHADGQYSYDQEVYSTDVCIDGLDATVTAVRER